MTMMQLIVVALVVSVIPSSVILVQFYSTRAQLYEIHKLVNNQLDRALERVETLRSEITDLKVEALERIKELVAAKDTIQQQQQQHKP